MSDVKVIKQLNQLKEESGMNAKQLTQLLGLSTTSFTDWNRGKSNPSLDAVVKFAEHFNVSLEWIVYGEELGSDYSRDEKELIRKYSSLNDEMKIRLTAYLDGMLMAQNK